MSNPDPPVIPRRIGLIVPSSNVVIEPEIARLMAQQDHAEFSFHASRLRETSSMSTQIERTSAQRERCLLELGDARVDAILDAVLTPSWLGGPAETRRSQSAIAEQLSNGGLQTRVRSVAGAIVEALRHLGARHIALVMPKSRVSVQEIAGYFEAEGFDVTTADMLPGGTSLDPSVQGEALLAKGADLDLQRVDSLVLACDVSVPSVHLIELAEERFALPVVTGTSAASFSLLRALGIEPAISGAGRLLAADSPVPARLSLSS